MDDKAASKHCAWRMALIIIHAIILAITVAFNYLAVPGLASNSGLYESSTTEISDMYPTIITPAGWTFTIWAFIYTWQMVHAVYSLTLLCRKTSDGGYLYTEPGHMHFSFYIVYIINNVFNTAWIFVFDRSARLPNFLIFAMILLWLITFTIYICGVLVCKFLGRAGAALERLGQVKDIWMTRIFILNGLIFYGTWCTIASLLNFGIVIQHLAGVDAYVSAWVCLAVLTAELITWFILQTFVFDRHLRYCFSQYIVLLVAFSGLLSNHYNSASPEAYTLYVMFLLALSGLLGLITFIIIIVKGIRNPINYNNIIEPTTKDVQNTHL